MERAAQAGGQHAEDERSYEQLVQELEVCVRDLEEGKLPLEKAIDRFKEGIALVKVAEKRLQQAENQVHLLLQAEDGSERTQAFVAPEASPTGQRLATSAPARASARAEDDIPF